MRLSHATDSGLVGQHLVHRGIHLQPVPLLFGQLRPSRRRERVELGSPPIFQLPPLSFDPAIFGQSMQSGEKGPGAHNEHAARNLLYTIGNADAVQWAKFERAEDEKIERPLEKIAGFLHTDDYIASRYRLSI